MAALFPILGWLPKYDRAWLRSDRVAGLTVADTAAAVVLKNNVLVGSVNANKRHWYKAGENLARSNRASLSRLITRGEKPENFQQALARQPDDIKVSIQFSKI